MIPIDDPDDPRIQDYRHIREADLVGRQGRFIAEGLVVLRALLRAPRHRGLSLLIAAQRLPALAPILADLDETVPVYSAGQAVLDQIAGFPMHRGILALGAAAEPVMPAALLRQAGSRALVAVLCGIANHDNMGGIFRNAAAFGLAGLLLDAQCCDPLYRKALRVSVGAGLLVPFARLAHDADPIALLQAEGYLPVALSPAGGMPLSALRRVDRMAVILGAEGPGLSARILGSCQTIGIPMANDFDSLNVATTSGIVLHHLAFGPL